MFFFVGRCSCVISLLVLAAVFWKVKQKYDRHRAIQRMRIERQQWANRPFASHKLLFDKSRPVGRSASKRLQLTERVAQSVECECEEEQVLAPDDVYVDILKQQRPTRVEEVRELRGSSRRPPGDAAAAAVVVLEESEQKLIDSLPSSADSSPTEVQINLQIISIGQ